MWSQVFKIAGMSKGALVVGVAASAAMVSNAEFTNTPSHNELPSATPLTSVAPATSSRPATSPSAPASPKSEASSAPSAAALQHGRVPDIFKECVERYLAIRELGDKASDADRQAVGEVCKAALAQSGLSPAEFWAKFGPETKTTAPKTEPTANADLEALVKECIAQRQAGTADQSDACRKAIAASGLTPQEFWTKLEKYLATTKTELSSEVMHWVQECVTKYTNHATDASQTCIKAIGLTGLTSSQFAERFLKTTTPTTTPSTKPQTAALEQLVYVCRKLQGAITDASTTEQFNIASAACDKAVAASGLSTDEFWAKWPPIKLSTPPASTPKPTSTTKPVTNTAELSQLVAKCLDLYKTITSTGGDTKAASDACRIAIQASGMSSADFWAKYHPTAATN